MPARWQVLRRSGPAVATVLVAVGLFLAAQGSATAHADPVHADAAQSPRIAERTATESPGSGVDGEGGESSLSDEELGAQLYAQSCASCHGSEGRGAEVGDSGRQAPALRGREEVDAAYIDLVLRTGRMPPAADPFNNQPRAVVYEGEKRRALVAYTVRAFDLESTIPDPPKGNPARGREVYAANCQHCHGATGGGGVAGGGAWTPPVTGYEPVAIAEAIRVGPFQMPAFAESQITEQEVGAVAAFLDEAASEEGTPILGLVELNPVFAAGFAAAFALIVMASLFWVSGRANAFPDPETAESPETAAPAEEEATTRERDESTDVLGNRPE